jgi:hypothetical protein
MTENKGEVIYKFSLAIGQGTYLELPKNARVRAVGHQNGGVVMWVQLQPDAPKVRRVFTVVGTGWDGIGRDDLYVGTVQVTPYVWHVFESSFKEELGGKKESEEAAGRAD